MYFGLILWGCSSSVQKNNSSTDSGETTVADTSVEVQDLCSELGLPISEFDTSVTGISYNTPFPDFSLQTTSGLWQMSTEWTGCDVYIFFNTHPDYDYPVQVWGSDLGSLIENSPRNAHYFFSSFNQGYEEAEVTELQDRFDQAVASLSEEDREHWTNRFHFVTDSPWTADQIGTLMGARADWAFSIDGHQNLREVGYLALPSGSSWVASMNGLAYEARYWTAQILQNDGIENLNSTPFITFDGSSVGSGYATLALPSESEMANYDSLHMELELVCGDPLSEGCGEWDYLIYSYLCDDAPAENPLIDQSCDPGSDEIMGSCFINEIDVESACSDTENCATLVVDETDTYSCEGYTESIAAEAEVCNCEDPINGTVNAAQTCREDGSGFDDCNCACDTEIGRWITSYARGGHWLMDASPALAMLKEGGDREIRFSSSYAYENTLTFHLSNQGKEGRAQDMIALYQGGSFNESYNDNYDAIAVDIPSDAKVVELYAVISGHGWGSEVENCAEFCNHTHHFQVNGDEYVKSHPEAGLSTGCVDQIELGTVPNQFGTWPYGRGGWCPGKQVDPWIVDVTESIEVGSENTINYEGLFNGATYVPESSNSGQGFGANIKMISYLVISY